MRDSVVCIGLSELRWLARGAIRAKSSRLARCSPRDCTHWEPPMHDSTVRKDSVWAPVLRELMAQNWPQTLGASR